VSTPAIDRAVFNRMYEEGDDPWGFTTSAYEARKRRITVASLPSERYASAFEPGCATGLLTEQLATCCDHVRACDVASRALELAAERVGARANVTLEAREVPSDWPDDRFDLILVSELGYFLTPHELEQFVQRAAETLLPGGDLMAVHWLGPIDGYPLDGRAVHERLERGPWRRIVEHGEPEFLLEVFRA
jgi:cyclopropane fatty-acyl-phospholipid synthase-like methyltransferase